MGTLEANAREMFLEGAQEIQSEFHKYRDEPNPTIIAHRLEYGKQKLKELSGPGIHRYTIPTAPGGSKFERDDPVPLKFVYGPYNGLDWDTYSNLEDEEGDT
eukprot:TRINITY_DN5662_c0_g1_i2.p1 TRINITY_DN5662_c0_g1~~TRINITY_DN5662_c0_g1_i2.p1  ORF type:complete len:102 (+),score=19.78 TRINITY_DN5662_c0_g1_i2:125-430(+)